MSTSRYVDTILHDRTAAFKTGWPDAYVEWVRAGLFGRRLVGVVGEAIEFSDACSARGRTRVPIDRTLPVDQRVARVESNLEQVDKELDSVFREIDQREADAKARVREEARKRDEAVRGLEDKIRDSAIGNFPILVFGAVWLVVGTILSALAPEIVRTVAGQWVAVWQAF